MKTAQNVVTFKLLAMLLIACSSVIAQKYDLVINNGRVMALEPMYDSIGNVGIRAGRIAVITRQPITGKETIDATGLMVAPGFIDTHFHSVDVFATKVALRDGVTTGMDLQQGSTRVGGSVEENRAGVYDDGLPVLRSRAVAMVQPEGPEFHDVMAHVKAAGFKVLVGPAPRRIPWVAISTRRSARSSSISRRSTNIQSSTGSSAPHRAL